MNSYFTNSKGYRVIPWIFLLLVVIVSLVYQKDMFMYIYKYIHVNDEDGSMLALTLLILFILLDLFMVIIVVLYLYYSIKNQLFTSIQPDIQSNIITESNISEPARKSNTLIESEKDSEKEALKNSES